MAMETFGRPTTHTLMLSPDTELAHTTYSSCLALLAFLFFFFFVFLAISFEPQWCTDPSCTHSTNTEILFDDAPTSMRCKTISLLLFRQLQLYFVRQINFNFSVIVFITISRLQTAITMPHVLGACKQVCNRHRGGNDVNYKTTRTYNTKNRVQNIIYLHYL